MTSGFKINLLIKLSSIFAEKPKDLKTYLTGVSRSKLLNASTFFLGFSNTQSEFEEYKDFLSMFFCQENNALANEIYNKLNIIRKTENADLVIINPLTSLQLFEFCFDYLGDEETQTNAESEINILKSILFLNEQNINLQDAAFASTKEISENIKLAAMSLSSTFPYSEFVNYDKYELFAGQMIKSIFLFEFLESNPQTSTLLSEFLKYFECNDWKSFLRNLLPLTFAVIESVKEAHIDINIEKDDNFQSGCKFIEKLIVSDTEILNDYDFKKIRSKPFYKVEEGLYRIIFGLFVLELVHKGVYFK